MALIEFYTDSGAGLCANFNRILTFLSKCQPIHSVKWRMYGQESGCMGYKTDKELFGQIFNEFESSLNINNTIKSYHWEHFCFDPSRITGKEAFQYYGNNRHKLEPYTNVYKHFFSLKDEFKLRVDEKIKDLRNEIESKKVVGIIVRNSALAGEQLRNKMPTREEYKEQIDRFKDHRFFLCVDNEDDLEYFKSICQDFYHTDIRRSLNSNDIEPHKKTVAYNDEFIKTFVEIYLCSSCDILIHCITNMATTSLILNSNQQSIHI